MKALVTALLLLAISEAANAESYLCVADASTGFAYNKASKRWEPMIFKIAGTRYSLSEKAGTWSWLELGEKYPKQCGKFDELGRIHCDQYGIRIVFDKRTLRYTMDYDPGTTLNGDNINPDDASDDTPYIEIGRCSSGGLVLPRAR